jgi:uncharacterized protein YndB with AHSA1/START domain
MCSQVGIRSFDPPVGDPSLTLCCLIGLQTKRIDLIRAGKKAEDRAMKLSAREDIEAPIDYVFDKVGDFALLERSGMRRGVEVVRKEAEGRTSWDLGFSFRGRPRKALVTLEKVEAPNSLVASFSSGGLTGHTVVELIALSRNRTRLSISVEFAPQSLSARLLVQSLRLAKMTITRRFKTRVADIAEDIEESYRG